MGCFRPPKKKKKVFMFWGPPEFWSRSEDRSKKCPYSEINRMWMQHSGIDLMDWMVRLVPLEYKIEEKSVCTSIFLQFSTYMLAPFCAEIILDFYISKLLQLNVSGKTCLEHSLVFHSKFRSSPMNSNERKNVVVAFDVTDIFGKMRR